MKRIWVTLKGCWIIIVLQVISLMSVAPSQQGLFSALTKDKRSAFKWCHLGTLCIVRCQNMGQLVNSSAGLEAHSSCTLPFRVCILLYHALYHFTYIILINHMLYYLIYDILYYTISIFSTVAHLKLQCVEVACNASCPPWCIKYLCLEGLIDDLIGRLLLSSACSFKGQNTLHSHAFVSVAFHITCHGLEL